MNALFNTKRRMKPTTNAMNTIHQFVRYLTTWTAFAVFHFVFPSIRSVFTRSLYSIRVWNLVFGTYTLLNFITVSRYAMNFSQTI